MPAAKLTAVLGNCRRIGRWKIRPTTKALVVFGNCSIDYTKAYADPDLEEIKLDVLCIFGRAVFTLPPGASVQPSSVSMFSSSNFDVEHLDEQDLESVERDGLPIIKMQTTTVLGMCRVQTAHVEPLDILDPPVGESPREFEPPSVVDTIGGSHAEQDTEQSTMPIPSPPRTDMSEPREPLTPDLTPPPLMWTTADQSEDGSDLSAGRLEGLDRSKAITIDDDDDTVHIAA